MHDIVLLFQVVALICFFIGWMAWSLPASHPLYWMCGGFFWLLLSWMIGGLEIGLHTVHP